MFHTSSHRNRRLRLRSRLGLTVVLAGVLAASLAAPGPTSAATASTPYSYRVLNNPLPSAGSQWGYRVVSASTAGPRGGAPASIGDLDGDGVGDFFVSTPRSGRVDLMSGRRLAPTSSFSAPEPQSSNFGFYVAVLGDVNGDSKPDLAIGTDAQNVGTNTGQGKAWVFSGTGGATDTAAQQAPLYALDNPVPQSYARFGSRIGRAGDVVKADGTPGADGISEVIVGASNQDVCVTQSCRDALLLRTDKACGTVSSPPPVGCRVNQGQAFVFNGANGALVRTLDMPDPDQPIGTCSSNCGTFGLAVQGVGDVNGDGVTDHLVDAGNYSYDMATGGGPGAVGGSCQTSPPTALCNTAQGRMYLFSGANGALLARIDDPVPQKGATFGFQDAAPLSPGDVNDDGVADIYGNGFQQHSADGLLLSAGRAWVFNGAATMATEDVRYADSAKNGVMLYEVVSPEPKYGGQFGWSMATTDYDRNGRPDLYIGSAPHHQSNTTDTSGGTYVFNGVNGSALKTLTLSPTDAQTEGGQGSELGWGLAAPGDLNGDGDPDYLAGAPHHDLGSNSSEGIVVSFLSPTPLADFDGDDDTDVAVYRPSQGTWFVPGATTRWGTTGDIPVAGDYSGDGRAEVAVFRPSSGTWFVKDGPTVAYGTNGDIPVPGDYDGDGDDDIAVFRPSSGTWFVKDGPTVAYGTNGDIPVPADYDGDRKTDIAVFRPSTGTWFVKDGPTASWGTNGDIPVPADYSNGDAKAEMAVFRPSTGTWFVKDGRTIAYGANGDIPVPGDYNGDGLADHAVFRPSQGTWYVFGGATTAWGTSGDVPAPLSPALKMSFF